MCYDAAERRLSGMMLGRPAIRRVAGLLQLCLEQDQPVEKEYLPYRYEMAVGVKGGVPLFTVFMMLAPMK